MRRERRIRLMNSNPKNKRRSNRRKVREKRAPKSQLQPQINLQPNRNQYKPLLSPQSTMNTRTSLNNYSNA